MFKASRSYFDKWQRIATSFVLQPVILFGFLSLMLIALEDMLIGKDNPGSYYKVACGQQCLERDQFMSKVLTDQGGICTGCRTTLDSNKTDTANSGKQKLTPWKGGLTRYKTQQKSSGPGQTKSSIYGSSGFRFDRADYKKMAELSGSGDETKQQEKLAYTAIALALTAFVFISMLNYIPNLATDLAGGLYEVPNLFKEMGSHLPGADQLQGALKGASNQIAGRISKAFDSSPLQSYRK